MVTATAETTSTLSTEAVSGLVPVSRTAQAQPENGAPRFRDATNHTQRVEAGVARTG